MPRPESENLRVEAGLLRPAEALPPSAGRRSTEAEKRALAERLRARGWSYRRIAEDLTVSYRTVARWLDGAEGTGGGTAVTALPVRLEPRRPPTAQPARPPAPRPSPPARPAEERELAERLLEENRAMAAQLERLVTLSVAQHKAILDLEARLARRIDEGGIRLVDRFLRGLRLLLRNSR